MEVFFFLLNNLLEENLSFKPLEPYVVVLVRFELLVFFLDLFVETHELISCSFFNLFFLSLIFILKFQLIQSDSHCIRFIEREITFHWNLFHFHNSKN